MIFQPNQEAGPRIAREFMKTWKAVFLEKRYFSAVLVGQDTNASIQKQNSAK